MTFFKILQYWFCADEVSKLKRRIRYLEKELFDLLDFISHPNKLQITVGSTKVVSSGNINMAFTLKNTEAVVVTAAVLDAAGIPVVGPVHSVFTSSDELILTVVAAADGLSATVTTTGVVGTATVTVEVEGFGASIDFEVVGSGVAQVTLTAGVPFSRLVAPAPVDPAPVV